MTVYVLVEIVLVDYLNATHAAARVFGSFTCWFMPYNSDPRKELSIRSGVSQANTNHRCVKDTDSDDEVTVEVVCGRRRDLSLVEMVSCLQYR